MIDDATLRAMSAEQRLDLRRRIAAIDGIESGITVGRRRFRFGLLVYTVLPFAMGGWIALLATTLHGLPLMVEIADPAVHRQR
ncbi:hypothetical protein [Nocardia heshunensis]